MAITSTESFLALLEKSELLGPKDLEKVRGVAGKYGDAKALAKALIAAKGLTRWQAGQLLAGRSSFSLGKFRLVDLLGRGGMGSVFLGEHKTMGRRVALKIISKQTGRDPAKLERFLNEARRIAGLDHPNIVRAFDVDHEGERYFLVLEYVEGRNLQEIVETEGPLEVARAARYIRQAASGLAHAHERKIIHCDIKPANLIVNHEDVVKILDMGMARLMEVDGSSSDSNENIVGTIDYIAPEQALEAEDLDHRVDVYSLGCTLYFLLTSRPPFGEGTLAQRIMRHQTQDPRPIAETRSGVPEELSAVCLKMMAKKPEDRFQTADEVVRALESWTGGATSHAASHENPGIAAGPAVVELVDDDEPSAGQAAEKEAPTLEQEAPESPPTEPDDGDVKIKIAEDSGSFSPRAGGARLRRSSRANKPAPPEAARNGAAGFFADRRKKWGTIIGAALLLLGAAGGGLALMLGGGTAPADNQVADASAQASDPPAPTTVETPADSDDGFELGGGLEDLEATFGGEGQSEAVSSAQATEEKPAPKPASTDASEADGPAQKPSATNETGESQKKPPLQEDTAKPKPAEAHSEDLAAPEGRQKPEKKPPDKKGPAERAAAENTEKTDEDGGEKSAEKPNQKPADVKPLKDFPEVVDLPVLSANDPPGEASKAPLALGSIGGGSELNWQMLLHGGDEVLKGGREFLLARTEPDAENAAWLIQIGDDDNAEKPNIARLWRDGQTLKFQWADDADGAAGNYLRNCFLQVRVGGESRYTALTRPVQAEPIVLDLLRGRSNGGAELEWAPDEELLRFTFDPIEGFEKAFFQPDGPVPPRSQVALNFVYTDRHENDASAVVFRILPTTRRNAVNVDVRLIKPLPRAFQSVVGNYNEQQLGVMLDRMGTTVETLRKKVENSRGEEKHKAAREIDATSVQMWYLKFFLKAHKKATLHYRVVADVGGRELLLVTTK